ncbi:MAG TPA: DinB family protein [Kofleriaceae bacterium]|nr:DinB family protein [Kofleriaceae bacterium]
MSLAAHYQAMAAYNTWMNRKLYALAAELPAEERSRDLGAFFKSVAGTFNHLLLTDRVWLARFTRTRVDGIRALDQILYDDFAELDRERAVTDAAIEAWAGQLTDDALHGDFTYKNMKGDPFVHPMWWAVSHFFNHQTHHRGQATTLFKQLGRDPGVTDLVAFLRTT